MRKKPSNYRKNNPPGKRKYPKAGSTLVATNPSLTTAERGLVQQSNREKLMQKMDGDKLTDKLVDILETDDPDKYSSAEKTLAMKIAAGVVYGDTGAEGTKNPTSAIQINITGLNKDSPDIKESGNADTGVIINGLPGADDA